MPPLSEFAACRFSERPGRPRSLAFVALHHQFDLFLDGLKVERGRLLHGWKFDERLRRRADRLLDLDEAPELARHEVVHVAAALIVERLAANRWRPFEGILAQIDDGRHVGRDFLARPAEWLLVKLELEVVDADGAELRFTKIENLVTRRRPLAGEQVGLVVAVEMVLVGPVAELHALQKLLNDVWIPRRRH